MTAERRKQSKAGTGRPRDRKCCKRGRAGWELGQGGVWDSKGYSSSPLHSLPESFEPPWLLEGLEHPRTRSSSPAPVSPFSPPMWRGGNLFCPDSSLVGATQSPLVASTTRIDLIWHVCEHWLLCPIQEFSKQEELISSVGHSQQLPHLDWGSDRVLKFLADFPPGCLPDLPPP